MRAGVEFCAVVRVVVIVVAQLQAGFDHRDRLGNNLRAAPEAGEVVADVERWLGLSAQNPV